VTFGIDVRWAGVCAAALVVVIMAASILDEGPAPTIVLPPPAAEPANVRARLLEKESAPAKKDAPGPSDAAASSKPQKAPAAAGEASNEIGQRGVSLSPRPPAGVSEAPPRQAFAPDAGIARPPAPQAGANVLAERSDVPAAPPPEAFDKELDAAAAAPAREEQKTAAGTRQKTAALAAPSSRARASSDAPGGEAGAGAAAGETVHVRVEAADGLGEAPALQAGAGDAALAPFRGREFVVVVESGGRVRSAAVWGESGALRDLRANAKAKDERESLSPFLELRFAPGERPRRLRLRID
jgi:hypothetical protein